jgi:NADH:ubiquinone oxidoreductase subunit 3 (subunit A)
MNSNKNQKQRNNESNSITMDLENLRQKYSNLLIQYKAAVADYVGFLNEQTQQPCGEYVVNSKGISERYYDYIWKKSGCGVPNQLLVTIKGQAFNGTGSAGQSTATTLQDCIASCSSSNTCTGATFVSNRCEIRTGDSPLVASSENSYAIIPKGKQLLLNMENINTQLLKANKELLNKIDSSKPVYAEKNQQNTSKNQELIQNYEKLLEERRNIAEVLNQYETLDNAQNENEIKITQNYYSYILLFALAVAVIILMYKMLGPKTTSTTPIIQSGGELGMNAYYTIFGLMLFVIILNW